MTGTWTPGHVQKPRVRCPGGSGAETPKSHLGQIGALISVSLLVDLAVKAFFFFFPFKSQRPSLGFFVRRTGDLPQQEVLAHTMPSGARTFPCSFHQHLRVFLLGDSIFGG